MSYQIPAQDVPVGATIMQGGREQRVITRCLVSTGEVALNFYRYAQDTLIEVYAFEDPRDELIVQQREELTRLRAAVPNTNIMTVRLLEPGEHPRSPADQFQIGDWLYWHWLPQEAAQKKVD